MKLYITLFLLAFIIGFSSLVTLTKANATQTKGLNAECEINNSDKACDEGLVCVPFNEESGNGKCQYAVTPTLTPTPKVSCTPIPTVSPTPTDEPKDYCDTLEGVQAEDVDCPEVTPTATPTEAPSQPGTPTDVVFVSQDQTPGTCEVKIGRLVPANFHIYRNGGDVIAKWVPDLTQGSEVVIWYTNDDTHTNYAVILPNTGYETIHLYNSSDAFSFWASYKDGCFVGNKTKAVVDSSTDTWRLFRQ